MYRLFLRPVTNYGTLTSTQLPRLRNLIVQRVDYQKSIQRVAGNPLSGNHLLIKLCYRLAEVLSASDVYSAIDDELDKICNPLGITNEYGFGKPHENFLYTETSFVIATTFDDQFTTTAWKDIRALRVLDHPFVSMELFIPEFTKESVIKDATTVIGIDIPLFGFQLKAWAIENSTLEEDQRENLSGFITKYVLPNMVNEYIDITVRNRLYYIVNNLLTPQERHERSFVIGYEEVIEKPLKVIISNIKNSNRPYLKGLAEIPMVFSKDYLSALPMEITSLNSYSYWIVFHTFIQWAYPLTFLVDKNYENSTNIITILHRIDRFINNHSYLSHLPEELKKSDLEKYEQIKNIFTV